mgnify:CR=1 FL=1
MTKAQTKGVKSLVGKKVKVIEIKAPYNHILGVLKSYDKDGWIEIQSDSGANIFYTKEAIGCIGEHIE